MIFWVIFFLSSLLISYLIALALPKKLKAYLGTLIFIALITPAVIDSASGTLAPSLFLFLYDLIFEQSLSIKSLRPLMLSLPISLIFLLVIYYFRKRFF